MYTYTLNSIKVGSPNVPRAFWHHRKRAPGLFLFLTLIWVGWEHIFWDMLIHIDRTNQ